MVTRITASIIICLLCPGILAAQEHRQWVFRAELGGYRIPSPSDGDESSAGVVVAAHLGRHLGENVLLDVGAMQGIGEDAFTGLESTAEFHLQAGERMYAFAGGGIGLLGKTDMSTLFAPYFLTGGVGLEVAAKHRIRLAVRWGRHVNFGESGTWPGPHMYTVS